MLPDVAREVVDTELRRLGACSPCVLRFLGTPASDAGAYRDACARDAAVASSSGDQTTCPCCLGILQLDPDPAKVDASDEDGLAPRVDVEGGGGGGGRGPPGPSSTREEDDVPPRRSPRLASHYAAGMRSAGHEIVSFALEVTLPPSIPMRQAAARALLFEALKRAPGAEGASSSLPATTELRDAFRATLVPALEATADAAGAPGVQHDPDAAFRLALLFEHERSRAEAGFATRTAEERAGRDPRNRKRRRSCGWRRFPSRPRPGGGASAQRTPSARREPAKRSPPSRASRRTNTRRARWRRCEANRATARRAKARARTETRATRVFRDARASSLRRARRAGFSPGTGPCTWAVGT